MQCSLGEFFLWWVCSVLPYLFWLVLVWVFFFLSDIKMFIPAASFLFLFAGNKFFLLFSQSDILFVGNEVCFLNAVESRYYFLIYSLSLWLFIIWLRLLILRVTNNVCLLISFTWLLVCGFLFLLTVLAFISCIFLGSVNLFRMKYFFPSVFCSAR